MKKKFSIIAALILSKRFVWIFPAILFITSLFGQANGVNILHAFYSAPYHFLGGGAMALLFLNFWEYHTSLYAFKKEPIVDCIMVLGFVELIGVLWEMYEFVKDTWLPVIPIFNPIIHQLTLPDTISDLLFDLLGALFIFTLYYNSALYKELDAKK